MKYVFLSFLVIGSLLMTSCRKKKDTIANIRVTGTNGQPVEQCMVVLYAPQTTSGQAQLITVNDTSYTNADGFATFNFNDIYQLGQTGVAILNIDAKKGNLVGQGIIKIESEVVNEENVIIQ
jgi:hypothetical protein